MRSPSVQANKGLAIQTLTALTCPSQKDYGQDIGQKAIQSHLLATTTETFGHSV